MSNTVILNIKIAARLFAVLSSSISHKYSAATFRNLIFHRLNEFKMDNLTTKDIRGIMAGTSVTFKLKSCIALYTAASLAYQVQGRYLDVDRVKYSCKKDTSNNTITIEARSID